MSQPTWGRRGTAWSRAYRLAWFLLLLAAPVALAERRTVNPDTQLSLDFDVKGATTCTLVPEALYDPKACEGIPQREAAGSQGSVRALVILRQDQDGVVLTVSSISRPGIGQMHEQHITGFILGSMKRLVEEFVAPVRLVDGEEKAYTVQQVDGVPVVRWEYTAEVPDVDPQANTASAVVYLVPSRDTLDIISLNTHRRNLEATRGFGEQVISTLRVPLTIDAEAFGDDMYLSLAAAVGRALVPLLAIGVGVWLWWRFRRRAASPSKRD